MGFLFCLQNHIKSYLTPYMDMECMNREKKENLSIKLEFTTDTTGKELRN